ncbi:MAG: rhomboid family intramembrane serine protease [Myxococcales bacterium]|jgi:membrane associated rhomboid family serine protease
MHPRHYQIKTAGMFSRPPRGVLAIMIATAVASVVALASAGAFGTGGLARLLLFSPSSVFDEWRIWTPFTYLFVTFSPIQLIFWEAFGLWMFASTLERQWGTRRFLYFFFATGAGAALLTTLLGAIAGPLRVAPPFAFDGTYVAFEAVILGWVLMNWHSTAMFFFFPMRAPWLLVIALVFPFLGIVAGNWIPYVPVLAGMGIGYLLLKRSLSVRGLWLRLRAWSIRRQLDRTRAKSHLRVVRDDDGVDSEQQRPPKYLN